MVNGLWMGWIDLPHVQGLFNPQNPIGMLVGTKLRDDNLNGLAGHICGITALGQASGAR